MITSVREVVDIEVFDKTTVLSEIYTFGDMVPIHILYFLGLFLLMYHREGIVRSFSKEQKYPLLEYKYSLLEYKYSLRKVRNSVRSVLFIILFVLTKNVDSAT
jgi:hypothetical protein